MSSEVTYEIFRVFLPRAVYRDQPTIARISSSAKVKSQEALPDYQQPLLVCVSPVLLPLSQSFSVRDNVCSQLEMGNVNTHLTEDGWWIVVTNLDS